MQAFPPMPPMLCPPPLDAAAAVLLAPMADAVADAMPAMPLAAACVMLATPEAADAMPPMPPMSWPEWSMLRECCRSVQRGGLEGWRGESQSAGGVWLG